MDPRINTDVYLEVLGKTEYRCGYCGEGLDDKKTDVGLIFPRSLGGLDEIDNLMACCKGCKKMKGHLTLEEFRAFVFNSISEVVNKAFDQVEKVIHLLKPEDRDEIEGALVNVNTMLKSRVHGGSHSFFFERLEASKEVSSVKVEAL